MSLKEEIGKRVCEICNPGGCVYTKQRAVKLCHFRRQQVQAICTLLAEKFRGIKPENLADFIKRELEG